jgi:hypothetical protein
MRGRRPRTKRDLLVLSSCGRNNRGASRFSIVYFQCKIAILDGHLYKLRFQFRIPRGIRALVVQNGKPKVSRFVRKSHRLP